MAKYIDAVRLRAEIEKKYKSEIYPWLSGVSATSAIYDYVLPLIDSLQQEQPEKSVQNDLDFEQELYNHFGQVKDFTLGMRIGQYFYELGCRRTAEKYDEIEYNRQQAEEEIPNDKVVEGEVILNGHGLLADVTKWGDGYKLKIIIRED